jgi:hypothetical protein
MSITIWSFERELRAARNPIPRAAMAMATPTAAGRFLWTAASAASSVADRATLRPNWVKIVWEWAVTPRSKYQC